MRGATTTGARAFKPPAKAGQRGADPLDIIENLPSFNELTATPILTPINDEWSISDPFEPVDPSDCTKYPASCEDDLLAIGPPVGFDVDIRINNCTTCIYIYPVVGWMRLTPTVICRRDPNCKDDNPKPLSAQERIKEDLPKFKLPTTRGCSTTAYFSSLVEFPNEVNNDNLGGYDPLYFGDAALGIPTSKGISREAFDSLLLKNRTISRGNFSYFYGSSLFTSISSIEYYFRTENNNLVRKDYVIVGISPRYTVGGLNSFTEAEFRQYIDRIYALATPFTIEEMVYGRENAAIGKTKLKFQLNFLDSCPNDKTRIEIEPTIKPPPPSPPPFGRDDDRQKKNKKGKEGGDDMCCNECRDSKENTDKLLKEIKEIKKSLGTGKLEKALNAAVGIGDDSVTGLLNKVAERIGIDSYPIEVPEALLQGQGDKVIKLQSNAEFLYWIVTQMDGLIGQFPIDIEVKDIDPLKAGDQKKTITLPNIAEAIAELYGLTIKSSVNQEVELNMLLRLAAETIATKNAAVVTQDYARANANFLGYKANYKPRELQYNFDFSGANLDPKAKQPIVLENLLRTVTGYVQGWQLEDKETVVGFMQKLMFSAGIIKAVFFRGKGNQKELNRELNSMSNDDKGQEAKFEAFIKEINDPNSKYNKDTLDKPEIKEDKPPEKPKGA